LQQESASAVLDFSANAEALAMTLSISNLTRCFAAATSPEDTGSISPCRRLMQLSREGSAEALQKEICKLQQCLGRQSVAQEIVTCEFGGRGSRSALHHAAMLGRAEVLTVLLEAGADPNALDDPCNTPLHHAASGGHARAVFVLLQAGANQMLGNSFGTTPVVKAEDNSWETASVSQGKAYIRRMFQSGIEGVVWEELPAEKSLSELQKQSSQQGAAPEKKESAVLGFWHTSKAGG